ncbi:type IX secretion system protein PorQ [Tunicatimonas pelagia]|uniref:type IX secretion system protein PorQ n=1 Tax=Tunicatimonas pelagia TaxID=931531 RepID=UPI00266583C4|nr:type IX secretion system protein PorQ [Tunicatimonas pelagia]WKN42690.1 type IX secretion system protein PorQ [Tunicatimonas pelagia]
MQRFILLLGITIATLSAQHLYAQVGGQRVFEFLEISSTAQITALGRQQVALGYDSSRVQEVTQFMFNPALNQPGLHQQVSIHYTPYYADIAQVSLGYSHHREAVGTFGVALQYLNYGSLESFDATGLPAGDFSAQDFAVVLNYSHEMRPFRLGGNLKWVNSQISGYAATGLLADVSGVFRHPTQDLTVALVFSNFGILLRDELSAGIRELPSDVKIGVSVKPQFMPFRFHFTAYRLINGYDYREEDGEELGIGGQILRHLSFGSELLLTPNFQLRVGYNHLTRSTLQLPQTAGGAGLTFGLMFRTNTFRVDYSRATLHAAGAFNQVGLSLNLDQIFLKKL